MENRAQIGEENFKKINLLPPGEGFKQRVCVRAYIFYNNLAPAYMTDIYTKHYSSQYSISPETILISASTNCHVLFLG